MLQRLVRKSVSVEYRTILAFIAYSLPFPAYPRNPSNRPFAVVVSVMLVFFENGVLRLSYSEHPIYLAVIRSAVLAISIRIFTKNPSEASFAKFKLWSLPSAMFALSSVCYHWASAIWSPPCVNGIRKTVSLFIVVIECKLHRHPPYFHDVISSLLYIASGLIALYNEWENNFFGLLLTLMSSAALAAYFVTLKLHTGPGNNMTVLDAFFYCNLSACIANIPQCIYFEGHIIVKTVFRLKFLVGFFLSCSMSLVAMLLSIFLIVYTTPFVASVAHQTQSVVYYCFAPLLFTEVMLAYNVFVSMFYGLCGTIYYLCAPFVKFPWLEEPKQNDPPLSPHQSDYLQDILVEDEIEGQMSSPELERSFSDW